MNSPYYYNSAQAARTGEATLIQRVSYLLCTALLCTAAAAYYAASAGLGPQWFLPIMIGTFACAFGVSFTRTKPVVSLVLLYGLSVLEGLLIGPLLGRIAHGYPLGSVIIGEAAGLSALLMAGLGTYVWMSSRDFGGLGKFLFWGLLGLLAVGLIGMFVHWSAGGHLLYAIIGAAIFVGFTLYDFSNIKRRFGPE